MEHFVERLNATISTRGGLLACSKAWGTSKSSICRWRKGSKPDFDSLHNIALTGVDINWLVTGRTPYRRVNMPAPIGVKS